ncbi:MAG: DUF2786 domain-containing protein [Proteobacteria bacterium]|nr:DUF2786 domain-containing protein [Pseudomonadota bacterium]
MDVRDRLEKLLALAASSNVHEAAAAAERAQRLIAEHRLEAWVRQTEVDPIEDARDTPLDSAKRPRRWKSVLASALAEANGCAAYTLKGPDQSHIVLVGRRSDREAVRAVWDWLVKRIEWLSASHGGGKGKKWHDAFRIGAVATIAERLSAADDEAYAAIEGAALVRVDHSMQAHRDALQDFVHAKLGLRSGRQIHVQPDAYAAGRVSARDLELPE